MDCRSQLKKNGRIDDYRKEWTITGFQILPVGTNHMYTDT
jgi:hypothetical protein